MTRDIVNYIKGTGKSEVIVIATEEQFQQEGDCFMIKKGKGERIKPSAEIALMLCLLMLFFFLLFSFCIHRHASTTMQEEQKQRTYSAATSSAAAGFDAMHK